MQNVLNTTKPVSGVTHPLVTSMYLKKDYNSEHEKNVLVIEARGHEDTEYETFDSYLIDILQDLEALRIKAEEKVGHFERVDIRKA